MLYFVPVFQTDDKISSEPKIKKLEPVLLPGKFQNLNVLWTEIVRNSIV